MDARTRSPRLPRPRGRCAVCPLPIRPSDSIGYLDGRKVHADCLPDERDSELHELAPPTRPAELDTPPAGLPPAWGEETAA